MRRKINIIAVVVTIGLLSSGCQLLIDNRKDGKSAVVVVSSDEWDSVRNQKLQSDFEADASKLLAVSIVDEMLARQAITDTSANENSNSPRKGKSAIEPFSGSQKIKFSNYTNSQLAGCSVIGVIEVLHTGSVGDAVTILKNEAHRVNANILVPVKMRQVTTKTEHSSNIKMEARMMKCPLKLARGN